MPHKKGLSITTMLLAIAVIPALLMFVVESAALYNQRIGEVEGDLKDRGELLATALAQSAQYGIIAGNTQVLVETMRQLKAADQSIVCLDVLGPGGALLARVGAPPVGQLPGRLLFERSIDIQRLDIGSAGTLDPSLVEPAPPASKAPATTRLGTARVMLSPDHLLTTKRHGLAVAAVQSLVAASICALIGWLLSLRLRRPLAGIVRALRRINAGHYDVHLPINRRGELGELQRTIVDMSNSLATLTQHLERTVAERTEELKSAVAVATGESAARRDLIARSHLLLEEERKRIAIEIHDHMNAALVVMRMNAQYIVNQVEKIAPTDPRTVDVVEVGQSIVRDVTALYSSARDIVKQLRPEVLDTLGLVGAIRQLIRSYHTASAACDVRLSVADSLPPLGDRASIAVYRLVQEALTNTVKHADAAIVSVSLGQSSDGGLVVRVEDDGRGFDTSKPAEGLGLLGMRERVESLGGIFVVSSEPGRGTVVEFSLPRDALAG